jgi:hypothetical protein
MRGNKHARTVGFAFGRHPAKSVFAFTGLAEDLLALLALEENAESCGAAFALAHGTS